MSTKTTSKTVQIKPVELKRILRASEELLDFTENILERAGAYKAEFLQGLKTSHKEARDGKVYKVSSLKDLS